MQENLLDSHEFLSWLVQRVDHIKPTDTKTNPYFPLMLYLPLVLKVSVVSLGGTSTKSTNLHLHSFQLPVTPFERVTFDLLRK